MCLCTLASLAQKQMITVAFFLSIWLLCTVSIAYAGDFFDFEAVDGTGNVVPLSKYKDAKAILVGTFCAKY